MRAQIKPNSIHQLYPAYLTYLVEGGELSGSRKEMEYLFDIASNADWAEGMSKDQILVELDRRIAFCENFIEQVIIDPKAIDEERMELIKTHSLPTYANPLSVQTTEGRHRAIKVYEELLDNLKSWKAELTE